MYLISGCVILICLLESATVLPKEGGPCDCPCPKPPPLILTEDAVAEDCCNSAGRFRYTCLPGYVRKAGTSNMAKCSILNGAASWTTPDLLCIPDPRAQTSGEPGPSSGPPGQAPVPSLVLVWPSTDRTDHETPTDEGVRGTGKFPATTLRASEFPGAMTTVSEFPDSMATATASPGHAATDASLTQATSLVAQVEEGSGDQRHESPPHDSEERTAVVTVSTVVSVLLVLLLCAGLSFYLCKWRSRPPQGEPTTLEEMPMNPQAM